MQASADTDAACIRRAADDTVQHSTHDSVKHVCVSSTTPGCIASRVYLSFLGVCLRLITTSSIVLVPA